MKRTEITAEQAKGKIVEEVYCADREQALILFTDNTFTVLSTEEDDSSIGGDWINLKVYPTEKLVNWGILIQEEVDSELKAMRDAVQSRREENDLKEFERLKAKFG